MQKILSKLHKVMKDVAYIQKDKKNAFHGYTYASEAAIKEKLHEAFVKHGVVFNFSVQKVSHDRFQDDKGKTVIMSTVDCHWTLGDADSGEFVSGDCAGVGQDSGDKAIYKAITGAIKYCLTANFLIATGDDAENDAPVTPYSAPGTVQPVPMPSNGIPPAKKPYSRYGSPQVVTPNVVGKDGEVLPF